MPDVGCNNYQNSLMFDNIIDKINLGLKERILAFFILWFAIYGTIWTILEPLNLPIPTDKLQLWRIVFISGTFLINAYIYFGFFFRKKLETLGLQAGDTSLVSTVSYSGSPTITEQNDGFHDKVLVITANYSNEPLNWNIRASANKASFLTVTYKAEPDLKLYAEVNVLSKNKRSSTQKWLRFEPTMSLPQSINDDAEMGVPVTASDDNGMSRINVNLSKTVVNAFGKHGWSYDKVIRVRARGSGKIKSFILK